MSNISVVVEDVNEYQLFVVGKIGRRDVIYVDFDKRTKKMRVGMSEVLPVDLEKAGEYVECYSQVVAKAKELQKAG